MNDLVRQTALILGKHNGATLAAARSLGRAGIDVTVALDGSGASIRACRYVRRVVALPSLRLRHLDWHAGLADHLRRHTYDLILPASRSHVAALCAHPADLPARASALLPGAAACLVASNRLKMISLAEQHGLSYPRSIPVSTMDDVAVVAGSLPYPVSLVPANPTVVSGQRLNELTTSTAADREALRQKIHRPLALGTVLIQEQTKGEHIGLVILADRGRAVARFQYRRMQARQDGEYSVLESMAVDESLFRAMSEILALLTWHGLADVSLVFESVSDRRMLTDMAAGTSEAIHSALSAGVDFPRLMCDMAVHGRTPATFPLYRIGRRCRLLAKDHPAQKGRIDVGDILSSLRGRSDLVALDDPGPGIALTAHRALAGARSISRRLGSRLSAVGLKRRRNTIVFDQDQFKRCLRIRPAVLFLCTGNICRSPFAELCLKRMLREANHCDWSVISAGLLDAPGRECPELAERVARSFGVDMTGHRSQTVTADMIADAGVVFVMDQGHRSELLHWFPGCAGKVFQLGAFDETADVDISDPYGHNEDVFRVIYARIETCAGKLADIILEGGSANK